MSSLFGDHEAILGSPTEPTPMSVGPCQSWSAARGWLIAPHEVNAGLAAPPALTWSRSPVSCPDACPFSPCSPYMVKEQIIPIPSPTDVLPSAWFMSLPFRETSAACSVFAAADV